MDIFKIQDSKLGVVDLTSGKKIKDFKNIMMFCSKRTLNFNSEILSKIEKEKFTNCISKYYEL